MDLPFGLDPATVGRVVLGAVPVLTAVIGLTRGPGAQRAKLAQDVDLLAKIPADTESRKRFEEYVRGRIDQFVVTESEGRRAVQGLVIGLILVLAFVALAIWLFTLDDWWWWIVGAVVALFALAGGLPSVYADAQRVPRGEDGKPL